MGKLSDLAKAKQVLVAKPSVAPTSVSVWLTSATLHCIHPSSLVGKAKGLVPRTQEMPKACGQWGPALHSLSNGP